MKTYLLFILFTLVTLSVIPQENSLILYPTDDTYLYKGSAGTGNEIRGIEDFLRTYLTGNDAIFTRESYLKFDLSSISNPELIKTVILKLYGSNKNPNIHTLNIHHFIGTGWDEDNLTYNNKSAILGISEGIIASLKTTLTEEKYYEWNITEGIKNYLRKKTSNKVSIALKEGTSEKTTSGSGIVVDWHSKDKVNGKSPFLMITFEDTKDIELLNIKMDENDLPGFSSKVFFYKISLPYGTVSIPHITAEKQEGTSIIYEHATNLNGTEEQRTSKIKVKKDNQTLTYKIIFELLPPNNEARLQNIMIDNYILENFNKDQTEYNFYLPYTYNSIPEIIPTPISSESTIHIEKNLNIYGSKNERTACIEVLSGDKNVKIIYYITFEVMPKLDLFLCIGQSNMAGRGYLDESKGDLVPIDNAFLFTSSCQWEVASNPMNKYSSIRKELIHQQMSPAYMFAKEMVEKTAKQIGLVVNARGGSSIESWRKGHPDKLYDEALRRALEAKKWGEFKAIVWHQGESNSSKSSEYPEKLKNLVADLRNDLNDNNLYFIAGELAYWRGNGTGSTNFNNMIRTISSFIDNSGYVSAEGLKPLIDKSDPHFDRESQLILGKRYADKVLSNVYNISSIINDNNLNCNKIKIIPNPVTDTFNIISEIPITNIKIYDLEGTRIHDEFTEEQKHIQINSADWLNGIYCVHIKNYNRIIGSYKIIKE